MNYPFYTRGAAKNGLPQCLTPVKADSVPALEPMDSSHLFRLHYLLRDASVKYVIQPEEPDESGETQDRFRTSVLSDDTLTAAVYPYQRACDYAYLSESVVSTVPLPPEEDTGVSRDVVQDIYVNPRSLAFMFTRDEGDPGYGTYYETPSNSFATVFAAAYASDDAFSIQEDPNDPDGLIYSSASYVIEELYVNAYDDALDFFVSIDEEFETISESSVTLNGIPFKRVTYRYEYTFGENPPPSVLPATLDLQLGFFDYPGTQVEE